MTRQTNFISATTAATASATAGLQKPSPDSSVAQAPESVNVESDFVVILAALLCALICVVGLIAVARCAWLRRSTPVTGNRSPSQALANKGLKKKVLQSLPKFTYSYEHRRRCGDSDGEECAICLTEFVVGDEMRMLPQCGHRFHVGCIDTWLGSHSSCPSCRMILGVGGRCTRCGEIPADTTTTAAAAAITASTSVASSSNNNNNNGVRVVVASSEVDRKAREDNSSTSTFLP